MKINFIDIYIFCFLQQYEKNSSPLLNKEHILTVNPIPLEFLRFRAKTLPHIK